MPRALKFLLITLAAILGLLALVIAYLAITFDPNTLKPQLIQLVQDQKQRTLSIPGDIKLNVFPKIGVELGQLSISEHRSQEAFASVNSVRLSLALLPLLSKQLVVDQVRVDALQARIVRNEDGSTNIDDLISKEDGAGQQLQFDIAGVRVTNSRLELDDRQAKRRLTFSDIHLDTGRIANDQPSKLDFAARVQSSAPQADARIAVKSNFQFSLDQQGRQKQVALNGLDLKVDGAFLDFTDTAIALTGDVDLQPQAKRFILADLRGSIQGKRAGQPLDAQVSVPKFAVTNDQVAGGKIALKAQFADGTRRIALDMILPGFEGTPQAFKLPGLDLHARLNDVGTHVDAKLSGSLTGDIDKLIFNAPQLKLDLAGKQGESAIDGTLATALNINLSTQQIALTDFATNLTLPTPGGNPLALQLNGHANIDLGKQVVSSALKGKLDEGGFDAKLGLRGFLPATYDFDIAIDKLDADRYLPKPAQKDPKPHAGTNNADTAIDLSALQNLRANGSLRIGSLKVKNIRTANVRIDLRAADGKLHLQPLRADLYGGSVNGAIAVTAAKPARFAVRQTLANVNVGPLLQDATGSAPITGRGKVAFDVNAVGGTLGQVKKSLDGTARLELRDGAVQGINLAQVIRNAKARLGQAKGGQAKGGEQQVGTGSTTEKTDFSELSASFKIANGVARNDDLRLKSPLIRVGGAGAIDLGNDRIDTTVRATVVSTLQGQGGPELQSLKGLTIPVQLEGPFTAIGWRIDFAGLVRGLAAKRVDEKSEEVRSKLQEQLQQGLKGLFEK